jgi:hypothetical protein
MLPTLLKNVAHPRVLIPDPNLDLALRYTRYLTLICTPPVIVLIKKYEY